MGQPLKGMKLDQPMQGWIERLNTRVNASAQKVVPATVNNIFIASADGDLVDSGVPISAGSSIGADYIGERYLTEAPLPEAGTEDGARPGSFRIGLLTEDDYAFFDEYGKLIFYGVAGLRLITPINHATTPTMFAVLDATGNLQYRTAAQLASDLATYIDADIEQAKVDVEQWAAERFITENLLDEAEPEMSPFVYSDLVADDGFFLLPEITNCAFGTVTIASGGVIEASAEFEIDSTGTVNLIRATANIVVNIAAPGTDAKFNIGIGTVNPVICKNRLGGPRRPLFRLWYN